MADNQIISLIAQHAHHLTASKNDLSPLLDDIGDASVVLLGEATHGTDEFYAIRSEITKQLIEKKDFQAICIEADWPDAYRVNRYIQGQKTDKNSVHALDGFKRFPQWMWRNTQIVELVSWLYHHNEKLVQEKKVNLYGLDLYSLYASIDEVLNYLDKTNPTLADRARKRYDCFNEYRHNAQVYGYATTFDLSVSCEKKVIEQLMDLRESAIELLRVDGQKASDEFFYALQNAKLVKSAEEYYRSLFFSTPETSWNIRDTHMMETAQSVLEHLKDSGKPAKIIIWAHNSHLGNAAATQFKKNGEINLGQLMKEKYESKVKSIGFTTYSGTVSAASEWDGPVERKQVRPSLENSYEALLHEVGIAQFLLLLQKDTELAQALAEEKLQRAIGVIYRPETERASHYFMAQLSKQFDAIIHIDQSTALEPLEKNPEWISVEFPESYPTGI
jgi:erythromycin esterase-like protein